jgi:hypothetical protein
VSCVTREPLCRRAHDRECGEGKSKDAQNNERLPRGCDWGAQEGGDDVGKYLREGHAWKERRTKKGHSPPQQTRPVT